MTFGLVLVAAAAATVRVAGQPSNILGAEEVRATVETADQQARTVLLRGRPAGSSRSTRARRCATFRR